MSIEYKDIHNFDSKELERLFLSVDWSSGHFPDKLVVAMKNFNTVYSAWDGNKLIGMICAMDDELHFYEACGFEKSNNASPMFITSLWT